MNAIAEVEAHPLAGPLPADQPAATPASPDYARARLAEIAEMLGAPKTRQPDPRTATHRRAIARFLLFAFARQNEENT